MSGNTFDLIGKFSLDFSGLIFAGAVLFMLLLAWIIHESP